MRRALAELVIVGVPTSQSFHRAVLGEPEFLSGTYDIGYFDRQATALMNGDAGGDVALAEIAVAAALAEEARRGGTTAPLEALDEGREDSAWLRVARLRGLR
jgi:acetyl/propionyl-CoA carboxylase alpha subunit